jgi:hypothetical protein
MRRWVKAPLIGVPLVLLGALVLLLVGTLRWVAGAGDPPGSADGRRPLYVCGSARADRERPSLSSLARWPQRRSSAEWLNFQLLDFSNIGLLDWLAGGPGAGANSFENYLSS